MATVGTLTPPDKQILQQPQAEDIRDLPQEEPTDVPQEEPDNEELEAAIKELFNLAEKEDEDLRYRLLQTWKRNDYYFNNIQNIFFDSVARDYRTIDNALSEMLSMGDADDIKTINIYRAYAESIIAALSVQPPNLDFGPDDAEDPEDIETADAYNKIAELVSLHGNANLMLIKALTLLYNCGVVAGHNYYKTDPKYGVISTPKNSATKETNLIDLICPQCSNVIEKDLPGPLQPGQDANVSCEYCGYNGQPEPQEHIEYSEEITEWDNTPKGRSGFALFGPTYVKMPIYARDQSNMPYLILRLEEPVSSLRKVYEDPEIRPGGGDTYLYERWARIPPEYFGTLPKNLTTVRYGWFRSSWYWNLPEEKAQLLENKYPNGFKATMINEDIMEHENGSLDDEWTVSVDPRANFIHAEPAGNATIPIQDAKNDVFNLGLQSIEYGIPETFANPKTLNFQKYNNTRATPGMVTPALPPGPDKALSDGFFSLKTATLSNEYISFSNDLDSTGQFVSAAVPSIWGGPQKTGDTTATEYTDSGARALQRLQIVWKIISVFWPNMITKCCTDFATNLREDERYTKKQNGTTINVWIRKSSLAGKIGHVQPELDSNIPQSWAQKKAFWMQLIGMAPNSPALESILLHPNNVENIKQATGMVDFYIPGEKDRTKQYQEFYAICQGKPVNIDLDVDDHPVHMQVLKNILVSSLGVTLYETQPQIYQLQIEHYRQHQMAEQAHTEGISGMTGIGQPPQTAANSTQG